MAIEINVVPSFWEVVHIEVIAITFSNQDSINIENLKLRNTAESKHITHLTG